MDDARDRDPQHWRRQAATLLGEGHPVAVWYAQHQGHEIESKGGGFNAVVLTCRTCNVSTSIG